MLQTTKFFKINLIWYIIILIETGYFDGSDKLKFTEYMHVNTYSYKHIKIQSWMNYKI